MILNDSRLYFRFAIAVSVAVLLGVGLFSWNYYNGKKNNISDGFEVGGEVIRLQLAPQVSDVNGLERNTSFALRSSRPLPTEVIKNNLRFSPTIGYEVKEKKFSVLPFIRNVLANSHTASMTNEYEITPIADLEAGAVYEIKTATSSSIDFDHDYSWAFKVKEEFDIAESFPADKSAGVPLNTGIEITFNRVDISDEIGKYFAIEPEVSGRFETSVNKITFIPKGNLKEKTLYKIIIKKGYVSGEKNESLAEDKTFVFETSSKDTSVAPPYLYWGSAYSELTPTRDPLFEAYGDATSSEAVVYKYDNAQSFLDDYYAYRYRDNQWSQYSKEAFAVKSGVKQIFKFKPELLKKEERNNFGLVRLPQKLDEGFYVLKLTTGKQAEYSFTRVSPLAYYYSEVNGDGLIWVYDFVNKKPFVDVSLSFVSKNGAVKEAGKTNQDGLLKFDSSSDKERKYFYETGRQGEEVDFTSMKFQGAGLTETVVPDVARMFEKKRNYFQGYLNTDRYAYRLTDKVHFWGVVKGRSFDLREKKVKVSLGGLVEKEVVVSPFDTIEGEIDFQGLNSGWQSLAITYNEELVAQAGIEIFSFEKPLYKIDIATDQSFSTTDRPVKAKIKVAFFDGTPVANMDLSYAIQWKDSEEGKIKTDSKGEAELSYTPKYYFERKSDEWTESWTSYPQSLRFTVRPTLSEEGEIWGETYINIYGPKIMMSSEVKEDGTTLTFKTKVNILNLSTSSEEGIIGSPAKGVALKAEIIKYYYEKIDDGESYDPVEKVKTKKYRYEIRKKIIKEVAGASDDKGEWSVTTENQRSDEFGFLKAIFSAADNDGKKVMSYADSYSYYPNDNTSLNLTNIDLDKKINAYKVGEDVHLKLEMTGKQKSVDGKTLMIRYQEGIRDIELIENDVFTDNFTDRYVPSMSYMAVRVMPNGFLQSNDITALFDQEEKRLRVDIRTEKERYRPGEEIKIDVNIKNKEKAAVKAVANIAAVDEALFNITPWGYGGDILSSLYASISAYPMSLSTSYVSDFKAGAEKGGCFVGGSMVTMSDGSAKDIADIRVGDVVKTFVNDMSPTLSASVVQGVSSHAVDGYLSINKKLRVTPEHVIFVSGRWKFAREAKVGDYLVRADRQSELIESIDYVNAKNVSVYNIIVGRYHTYFADGFYVHNAEKSGGGDTRNYFQDTPLYRQLESDVNGIIKTSFKAPDNLTSWRVSVNAYDQAGMQAGSEDKLVPIGLPLFVDVIVAKQYLVGDNPILKVRVFGSEYQSKHPAEFRVVSDSLDINFVSTTTAGEINLPLGKLKAGKHKIEVSLRQGGLRDALEKEFTVYENYQTHYTSDSQTIANGPANLKRTANGLTDLLFVDDGKGKYYNELLNLIWGGSIRSDIQAASYLAGKTLNDVFHGGREQFPADIDLGKFQNYNNAYNVITLFPYSAANFLLTAELADVMPEKFAKMSVIDGLRTKTADKKSNIVEISQSLYGLSALGQSNLPFINYLRSNASTTLEARVYLALALHEAGDVEGARAMYYDELLPQLKIDETQAYLNLGKDETRNIKTTAVLGMLAAYLEPSDSEPVLKMLIYLRNNAPKDDSTILERAIIIRSEIMKRDGTEASLTYVTKSRQGKIDLSRGQSFALTLTEDELKSLTFSDVTGKSRVIAYYEEAAAAADLKKSKKVSVKRVFLVNGKETTDLKEGDLVTVRLDPEFAKDAPDDIYQLVDYLPSGLKPIVREYDLDVQSDGSCDTIWYPVRRTDTAVYFNFGKWFEKSDSCRNRTLNYRARVVTKGSYKAQGTVVQSMNNLAIINSGDETSVSCK